MDRGALLFVHPSLVPVSFRILASYFFMYLSPCCYLSLLMGLFIPIKPPERQGLRDAAAEPWAI